MQEYIVAYRICGQYRLDAHDVADAFRRVSGESNNIIDIPDLTENVTVEPFYVRRADVPASGTEIMLRDIEDQLQTINSELEENGQTDSLLYSDIQKALTAVNNALESLGMQGGQP
ncbi:MAG: hypothetical protein K6T83_03750 [Alicyclobacillus sp.]|nr:hypothetical protein [Alicyclobacillus sp.]